MFRETVFDIAKRKMVESGIDGELGAEFAAQVSVYLFRLII